MTTWFREQSKEKMDIKNKNGFTLIELLMATIILLPIITGIMLVFMRSSELTEFSRNSSTAVWGCRDRLSTIEHTAFNQIFGTYNNVPFTIAGIDGKGVSYVNNSDPKLFQVTITFCWRQKNGRIIGEDSNLNGILNAGEDKNGNGILDSTVQISTLIYDMS